MEIFKIITSFEKSPIRAPLAIFSSFYPFPVQLKCNVIQQNWLVTIQAMKFDHGTKFRTLKVYLMWLFFDLMGK